nr:MAG TPA: hypothetical protein [Inoviridae sp.]
MTLCLSIPATAHHSFRHPISFLFTRSSVHPSPI